jgi:glutaredoxin
VFRNNHGNKGKPIVLIAINLVVVVVFSKSDCPYCTRAKNFLKEQGLEFTLFEVDNMKQGSEIQSILKELSGQSTGPNIFIKQKHDDLTKVVR